MEFSTTDWVAIFVFGASALQGTLGNRLVRIIGLAVMPFVFADALTLGLIAIIARSEMSAFGAERTLQAC
jgi:hypothetical protein